MCAWSSWNASNAYICRPWAYLCAHAIPRYVLHSNTYESWYHYHMMLCSAVLCRIVESARAHQATRVVQQKGSNKQQASAQLVASLSPLPLHRRKFSEMHTNGFACAKKENRQLIDWSVTIHLKYKVEWITNFVCVFQVTESPCSPFISMSVPNSILLHATAKTVEPIN